MKIQRTKLPCAFDRLNVQIDWNQSDTHSLKIEKKVKVDNNDDKAGYIFKHFQHEINLL